MWTWIEHKHKLRWMCVAQRRERESTNKKQSTPYESDWKCFQTMQNELAENEKNLTANGLVVVLRLRWRWEQLVYDITSDPTQPPGISFNCWRRRTRTFSHPTHLGRSRVKLCICQRSLGQSWRSHWTQQHLPKKVMRYFSLLLIYIFLCEIW